MPLALTYLPLIFIIHTHTNTHSHSLSLSLQCLENSFSAGSSGLTRNFSHLFGLVPNRDVSRKTDIAKVRSQSRRIIIFLKKTSKTWSCWLNSTINLFQLFRWALPQLFSRIMNTSFVFSPQPLSLCDLSKISSFFSVGVGWPRRDAACSHWKVVSEKISKSNN